MSSFSRRRKRDKVEPKKKKWALPSSSDDDDDDDTGFDSMACKTCGTEGDVFCEVCKIYLCVEHFNEIHEKLEEGWEPISSNEASSTGADTETGGRPAKRQKGTRVEEKREGDKKNTPHRFRVLIGLGARKLNKLTCGWDTSNPQPQKVIQARRLAEKKRRADVEKKEGEVMAAEALLKAEAEAEAHKAQAEAKRKSDEAYEEIQEEAEKRNRRDMNKNHLTPKSMRLDRPLSHQRRY